ncbi:hypothetical protein SNK04_002298 [Fusarium graminearum]
MVDRSPTDLASMANIKDTENTNARGMKDKQERENMLIQTLHVYSGRLSLDPLAPEEPP